MVHINAELAAPTGGPPVPADAPQNRRRVDDLVDQAQAVARDLTLAIQREADVLRAARNQTQQWIAAAEAEAGAIIAHAQRTADDIVARAWRDADEIRAEARLEAEEARAVTETLHEAVGSLNAAAADVWHELLEAPPNVAVPSAVTAPAPRRHLVPALPFKQELVLRGLVVAGLLAGAWFWLWWLTVGHGRWTPPAVIVTVLLGWVFALPFYFFFFASRMTRPNPAMPVPDLRCAIVVTKAPSEAWPILQRTLEAALAQEFPHPYDVWLADECPTQDSLRWCADRGVKVSTRFGVAEYHQPEWPRRTRSKEGNLAYFYDHVGYARYDVVAQLDADHVPTPGYLAAMVRPFADANVGYVSAPSVCDANADKAWTVRGRLFREAAMHGPVQAGSNGGFAPVCIGSHYAVRTAALQSVGGLGPELAEDYSTTLWMQSGGWDGVFNIDAEAHGDGPESVDAMLLQEVQWSRSLGVMLTRWAPSRLRAVPWRARLRLGFALLFYPLQGLALAVAAAIPATGVILGVAWGHTSLAAFYLHLWPYSLTSFAAVAYLRRAGLLRPPHAKLWSWELILFQLLRWPWALWAFFQGMYAGWRGRVVTFKVTPKGEDGLQPLTPKFLLPALALGIVPAWVVVLVPRAGPAIGLAVLALLQAVLYLGAVTIVIALHIAGNVRIARERSPGFSWRQLPGAAGGDAVLLTALAGGFTLAAVVWRLAAVGLR